VDAPFLELGFYFSDLSGDESIAHVYRRLVENGTMFSGTVVAPRARGIRQMAFPGLMNTSELAETALARAEDVLSLFADENVRVTRIMMHELPGFPHGTPFVLTQSAIPEACLQRDHNPVALWLDGSVLSHAPGKVPAKARRLGRQALEGFRQLIEYLRPAYAAITVDYGMECPCALRRDPRTLAFCDFYLSDAFLGRTALDDVRRGAPGAYHEDLGHGQLSCSSEYVAPEGVDVSMCDRDELSVATGRLIAAVEMRTH
jgi:hypothetical protein